jgi:hypothetical protein
MTQNLILEVSGDCWYNPFTFAEQLNAWTESSVTIDLRSEGPSLNLLGVTDIIDQWLIKRRLSPNVVTLFQWSNSVEWVPYQRSFCNSESHFFPMSQDYWAVKPQFVDNSNLNTKLFGVMIGRLSIPRTCMLYQAATHYSGHFFISKMPSREMMPWDVDYSQAKIFDNFDHWLPRHDQMRMIRWYNSSCPPSVDNLCVQDQFKTPVSYIDTNRSILNCYPKFAIELVAETYCQGETFFPTEKTVRPLMAMKPMLVYGPKYFLARLRNMGFKTWHHLWNESYDLLEGPERWDQIKRTMSELISAGQQHQIEILQQAREICKHNRQVLVQLVGKSRTLEPWMTEHDNS